MTAENASILWGEVVIDELARAGVRHVVITPGSRSTPLVVAAARHPEIVDHSLIDERSAAFFALGIGLATGRPAALVCTSGTAVANYLPAVAEADLAAVPLVVLTADRPPNLLDAGASQAMAQTGIFGEKVRWSCDLGLPSADAELLAHARARAARAVHVASAERGPVHLNLAFRKPLEQTEVAESHRDAVPAALLEAEVVTGRPGGAPWTRWTSPSPTPQFPAELVELLRQSRRPIVVVGAPASFGFWERDRLARLVEQLVDTWSVPVLAESMSGLRTRSRSDLIIEGDLVTADLEFTTTHQPDLIVQIGRWPINWPVIRWLEVQAAPRLVIGDRPADPVHGAAHIFAGPPWALESARDSLEPVESGWGRAWSDRAAALRRRFEAEASKRPDLDGHVARQMARTAANLFVSSSMPLREVETWLSADDARAEIFANRGLNGIDGVISTAAGVSVGLDAPVELLIGDVAFVHDVGGLVTARRTSADLRIRVIDNGGGRIFEHLPIARHDAALVEKHFTTAPGLDLVGVADSFGWTSAATTVADFVKVSPDADVVVVLARSDGQGARRDLLQSVVRAEGEPAATDPAAPEPAATDPAAPEPAATDRAVTDPAVTEPAADSHTAATPTTELSNARRPAAPHNDELPLVLLHGFTGDATTWDAFREHYSGPTLALDMLGHAGRPAPSRVEDASLHAFVTDLFAQLDAAGIERFDLFGYSMGGRVALAMALHAPDRVRTLTTLGANPGIESRIERLQRRDDDWALADSIERDGLDAFLRRWLDLPIFSSLSSLGDAWRERSIAQRMRGSARSYAQVLRGAGTGSQPPFWNALSDLTVPHLAIAGALDEKYVKIAQQLADRAPSTTALTISAAGHSAHYEQPRQIAEHVANFVRDDGASDPERNAS